MHGIVDTEALPRLEFAGGIHFLPAIVVDKLIFRTGNIRDLEIWVLYHVVNHAGVAAIGEFPLPVEDKVIVLSVGDDVTGQVASVAVSLDATIDDVPRLSKSRAVEIAPTVESLTVEEEFPSVGNFRFREDIRLRCIQNRERQQRYSQRESTMLKGNVHVVIRLFGYCSLNSVKLIIFCGNKCYLCKK